MQKNAGGIVDTGLYYISDTSQALQ
jgi:hypothetical protein